MNCGCIRYIVHQRNGLFFFSFLGKLVFVFRLEIADRVHGRRLFRKLNLFDPRSIYELMFTTIKQAER